MFASRTLGDCKRLQLTADTAIATEIEDVTTLRVGDRVEYRDANDDLACADLGAQIIVRHPSQHDRQLAGLRLAAAKWGDEPVEVVDLPLPGQAQMPEHKRPRTIEELHEAIRELEAIGRRIARKTEEMIEATGIDVRRRDRGDGGHDR